MILILAAGCKMAPVRDDQPATPKVGLSPFTEPRVGVVQAKFNVSPAPQETAARVELVGRKLISENSQVGRPNLIALGGTDPEIFHVGLFNIYVTDALVKQCATDGQLAAVLANEMGRIVSEREAAVADDIRQPEPLRPIQLPIAGNGNSREADPMSLIENARYEKQYPRRPTRLPPPNPQMVARGLLEHAGYLRTELDGAQPLLDNAARFSALEKQFKGIVQQADWKRP